MALFNRSNLGWLIDLATLMTVVVGLTFAGVELRHVRTAQESQTVLELFQTIRSPEYVLASSVIQELPEGLTAQELQETLSREEVRLITQLQLTYEALGLMVYRGDVSLEWVDELFRHFILESWDKLKPITYQRRENTGYRGFNEWHQWLAERLRDKSELQPVPAYEAFADWTP